MSTILTNGAMEQSLVVRIKSKAQGLISLCSYSIAAFALLASAVCFLSSCNPEAKAVSGLQVNIDITPQVISSGFMQFTMETDKEAYYHVGIVPRSEAPDLTSNAAVRAFMNLELDEAYTNYIVWRHSLLEQGEPYIAEFPTHSLQYGKIEYNFTLLKPATDYMVYAFVVDAKTNKPDGRLFTYYASTYDESFYADMQFEYRVRGYWDYVYPVYNFHGSEAYSIVDFVPWVGATVDSLDLLGAPYNTIHDFFGDLFGQYVDYQLSDWLRFGIYAHNNNGLGDGSSYTLFEEGHTYYTGLALMDGYLDRDIIVIYKFTWQGEDTQYYFTPVMRLTADW